MALKLKVLLCWALVCVGACSPEPSASDRSALPATKPLAGAWAQADVFSPDVQEAARFAVQTFAVQNKARVLYKDVTQARQQVVAGLNYELQLQVTMDGSTRTAKATVWLRLDGSYRLQSWDWLD